MLANLKKPKRRKSNLRIEQKEIFSRKKQHYYIEG